MNSAYLLLGGNIGNREKSIENAISEIGKRIGRVLKKSSLYETDTWPSGSENEEKSNDKHDYFLNQAILIETILSPHNLLEEILKIEKLLGRVRKGKKWEERIIDIDILFYEKSVETGKTGGKKKLCIILNEENLKIPHPYLHLRRFTLAPMNEIAPNLKHPDLNKTISELFIECKDKLEVKILI